jgi:hypothetical protein
LERRKGCYSLSFGCYAGEGGMLLPPLREGLLLPLQRMLRRGGCCCARGRVGNAFLLKIKNKKGSKSKGGAIVKKTFKF